MNANDLLTYYEQELAFIRELGAEFGKAHPKIAARLRLGDHMVEDPHVGRIMEAFALANAKIRYKLDDDLPEISDALLNILKPHLLAPIPSMSIVKFHVKPDRAFNEVTFPIGTEIRSNARYGTECFFQTCYPVSIYSFYINEATLQSKPCNAPKITASFDSAAILKISLRCFLPERSYPANLDKIRFYIKGNSEDAFLIYELLFNGTAALVLANSENDKHPVILDKSCLRAVGFHEDDKLLPYDDRTFLGYRHLLEFFTLPEKFLFFEITGIKKIIEKKFNSKGALQIYFFLKYSDQHLEKTVTASHFELSCTPIVNLFKTRSEQFRLSQMQTEYPIRLGSWHLPTVGEVYKVQKVLALDRKDQKKQYEIQPFYGLKNQENYDYYYHVTRRAGWEGNRYNPLSSELFISFSDMNLDPKTVGDYEIIADILATNGDLPRMLPFGGGEPELSIRVASTSELDKVECLLPMTPSYRPFLNHRNRFKFVSHLAMNHLSLLNDAEGVTVLKNLLKTYDFASSPAHQNLINGLVNIESKKMTARNPDLRRGNIFWHGTKINLTIDEKNFTGLGIYLFGAVLARFFSLFSTINSFTQLEINTLSKSKSYKYSATAGEKQLL